LPLIEFKNVTFTYLRKKTPAIKNINLSVDEGEFVVIIGPLGAGKSTLLRCLNGLVPHHFPGRLKGDVIVDGLNTKEHLITELAAHVGLVLDDPSIQIFGLSVEDDVAFGPINLGFELDEIERRMEYALKVLRLKGLEKRHPRELSGGQQQRVAIAGVLAMRPKIIALDEPISMLDPIGKSEVLTAIRELNREYGITCLISESGSDLEDVCSLATRVIIMDKGEILMDASPEEALSSGLTEKIGVGIPQVTELYLKLKERGIVNGVKPFVRVEDAAKTIRELITSGKLKVLAAKAEEEVEERKGRRIIKVRNLRFTYPTGVEALKGVDLDVYEGELVGLIGQNGSGKTTLSLNLVGVYKPTNEDAEIIVDDIDVVKSRPQDLIKHINYVFQNPDWQLFSANVEEEVSFALKMMDLPPDEIKARVQKVLSELGIEKYAKAQIVDLTRDLRTLVAIASILVLEPKVLIIDEPTGGLDRKGADELMSVLKRLCFEEGRTIIIITHDMKLVAENCSRVVVMRDGKIMLDGTPSYVFAHEKELTEAFLKPPQITQLSYRLSDLGIPETTLHVNEFLSLLVG